MDDQQRRPKCKEQHFKIGDKVLLKKRKINKWSTSHEKEFYEIIEIHGSTVEARRRSDGRTIERDASKFRFFQDVAEDNWREGLLRSSRGGKSSTQDRRAEETNEQENIEQRGEDTGKDENNRRQGRRARQQEEPKRRELPKRTRRLPAKFKDYVVETAL